MKLIILLTLGLVALLTYVIVEYSVKKWECREGNCVKVIGGKYETKEQCQTGCAQPYRDAHRRRLLTTRRKRVRFNETPEFIHAVPFGTTPVVY